MNEFESNEHQPDADRKVQEPPPPAESETSAVNNSASGNHRNKKEPHWPQRIEAVSAILLVIITGTYTYYSAGQLHKMKRAVEVAQGANEERNGALFGVHGLVCLKSA